MTPYVTRISICRDIRNHLEWETQDKLEKAMVEVLEVAHKSVARAMY